jgi:8-oxo-dGTP pyrophosphatase MutT (NUDIX family)
MSLLRHIRRCNDWRPQRFVPLRRGDDRIGLVRRDNAAALRQFPDVFSVAEDGVALIAPGGFAEVSAAIDRVCERLVGEGRVAKWRNEFFAVAARWEAQPVFKLDRGAVSFFGVRAYGVHVNGHLRQDGRLQLWIGRRAPDKKVAPDKLDNLVAGGIGDGHGLEATLVKEAEEEASLAPEIVARALPVGAVSYRMETEQGLRDDVLFLYDLEMPEEVTPRNRDGEIVAFTRMVAEDVVERVRATEDFKFNVNLVIIDFALRHGLVGPRDPEYLDLVAGLHRPPD